ncbi:hypothetical protein HOY80DRAFT_1089368 [Tuber brumale]|nr:hypothetical protein HOY80DRAFT_1089368 [Tuber brumale]
MPATADFRTELNLTGTGRTVSGRRYCAIRTFILQKFQKRNILNHRQADALILDMLKMPAESHRNARLNSDNKEKGEAEDTRNASGSAGAIVCQQVTLYKDSQELGEDACQCLEDSEHSGQFMELLHDIWRMNVTPDASNQIELICNDQVDTQLRLFLCTILTVATFYHRAAIEPPKASDPGYLDLGHFDIAKFYNEPDSDSKVEDNVEYQANHRRALPKSHAGWWWRILSNDRKIMRFQVYYWLRILCTHIRQGAVYMNKYVGQDIQSEALPIRIPPPGYQAPDGPVVEDL